MAESSQATGDRDEWPAFYQSLLSTHGVKHKIDDVRRKDAGLLNLLETNIVRRFVKVSFRDHNNVPSMHFLEKTRNKNFICVENPWNSFEKEITFYEKYLPAAKQFCKEKGQPETFVTEIYPKFYYGDANIIITEDLERSEEGYYRILGKVGYHNCDTAKLALSNLAKHHAIAHSLISDRGDAEIFFREFPNLNLDLLKTNYGKGMEPFWKSAITANMTVLEKNSVEGASETISEISALLNRSCRLIEWATHKLEVGGREFLVLNHGDYQYPMMRFVKDYQTKKVVKHKIIDFSKSCYNSPAVDVAYYLMTSVNSEVRQTQLQELLEHYLAEFTRFCNMLGNTVRLTYDTFFLHYQKKLYYPLLTSFLFRYGPMKRILMEEFTRGKLNRKNWTRTILKDHAKLLEDNSDGAITEAKEIVSVMKEFRELNSFQSQTNIK